MRTFLDSVFSARLWPSVCTSLCASLCITVCASGCFSPDVASDVVDSSGAASFSWPTPQFLSVDCPNFPASVELQAQLWISGSDVPCPLSVDLDTGITSGTCNIPVGRERLLTLDWFVQWPIENPDNQNNAGNDGADPILVPVVLAQVQTTLDLSDIATVVATPPSVNIDDADIRTTNCRDMRADSSEGETQIRINGALRSVCDLNDSCDGAENGTCNNVGDLCAGRDPVLPIQ